MTSTGSSCVTKGGQTYWRRRATSTKRHLTLESEGRATIRLLTVTVVAGYRARAESFTAITYGASSAKSLHIQDAREIIYS